MKRSLLSLLLVLVLFSVSGCFAGKQCKSCDGSGGSDAMADGGGGSDPFQHGDGGGGGQPSNPNAISERGGTDPFGFNTNPHSDTDRLARPDNLPQSEGGPLAHVDRTSLDSLVDPSDQSFNRDALGDEEVPKEEMQRILRNSGASGKQFTGKTTIKSHPVPIGGSILNYVALDPKSTFATVSYNCHTGAMANENTYFTQSLGIQTMRHSTLEGIAENIKRAGQAGAKTFIIGTHGSPGSAGALNISNAAGLGKALAEAGIERVIFTSCSTAGGQQGREFLKAITDASGVLAVAATRTLWAYTNKIAMHEPGELVAAVPEFQYNQYQPENQPRMAGSYVADASARERGAMGPRREILSYDEVH